VDFQSENQISESYSSKTTPDKHAANKKSGLKRNC
jgi:hypothetical protein